MNNNSIIKCRKCGTKNRVIVDNLHSVPHCGKCKAPLVIPDGTIRSVRNPSDTFGKSSMELLSKHTTPEEIADLPTKKLAAMLTKCSRGRFGIEKAEEIKAIAKNSFGIKLGADIFAFQIRQLLDQISLIEDQITEVEMEMEARLFCFKYQDVITNTKHINGGSNQ